MIEMLPNWHPVFVHFTIALLTMSVVFYVLKLIFAKNKQYQSALTLLAKTNLYLGVGFAFITALAGWFAYNSVNHDTASHLAMTEHRNIALITLAVFVILALWSLFAKNKTSILFVLLMVVAGGLLSATGWMGAEAVYRYGLGVMSMPKVTGEGHAHKHAEGQGHGDQNSPMSQQMKQSAEEMPHEHAAGEEHDKTKDMKMPMKSSATTQNEHDKTPHEHAEKQTTPEVKSHDETPHTH
ncbi:MAG: hypothetical protein DSZ29_01170 [Aquificaceae bacterium]|nr:MAG: hypothetical protein DSZ29_01170 [Aquificaceae bacterium]